MGSGSGNRCWHLRTQMAPTCVVIHRRQLTQDLNDRSVPLQRDAAPATNLDEPEETGAESEAEDWDQLSARSADQVRKAIVTAGYQEGVGCNSTPRQARFEIRYRQAHSPPHNDRGCVLQDPKDTWVVWIQILPYR